MKTVLAKFKQLGGLKGLALRRAYLESILKFNSVRLIGDVLVFRNLLRLQSLEVILLQNVNRQQSQSFMRKT
jgi:hypothetical protein